MPYLQVILQHALKMGASGVFASSKDHTCNSDVISQFCDKFKTTLFLDMSYFSTTSTLIALAIAELRVALHSKSQ